MTTTDVQPGWVVMLGSGETAPSMQKVYDWLFKQLDDAPRVSIMETPAGFEPNSAQVAQRIVDFFEHRLQNYRPQVAAIPARKRDSPFSPNDPDVVAPMRHSNVTFMGPGSPTYAVRQLQDTLAWHTLVARHRLGASLVFASASTLAMSAHTLPVYEIYKVGEDLHWHLGLDFFGLYGLSLVFIPHWNNNEGGSDLDTSRCYMGRARFARLMELLPPRHTVVGIDEHTALAFNFVEETCQVLGKSGVTLRREEGDETVFKTGEQFPMSEFGQVHKPPPETLVPPDVWQQVEGAMQQAQTPDKPPANVLELVEQRQAARAERDWATADRLRDEVQALGWAIQDNPNGPELQKS